MKHKNIIDSDILDRDSNFIPKYKKSLKLIEKYERIAVFRHVKPDYDALGCQMAMVAWIKDNFPQKEVIYTGEDHISLTPRCFPHMLKIDDAWFEKPFLAIVLDTSNSDRIADSRFKKAKEIIKIDHHPQVDKYGKVEIVDTTMSAAGELLANMLIRFEDYRISKECATYLYKAIVGDSNRFLYSDVSVHTFAVAKYLLHLGIDMVGIYKEMYSEDLSSLEFTKWVLSHYHISKKGVAYYVLEKEDLAKLKLKPEQGKECLYLFDHFDDVPIWASISFDEEKNVYRVSLRSNGVSVESVASKYMGGGHTQASGAKLKSLDELPKLIADLEKLLD